MNENFYKNTKTQSKIFEIEILWCVRYFVANIEENLVEINDDNCFVP